MTEPIAPEEPTAEGPDQTPEQTAEGTDQTPAPTFLASFTQADVRSLVVTIAGTVIGGTLLLMVVALAVVIAHVLSEPRQSHDRQLLNTVTLCVWVGAFLVVFVMLWLPRWRGNNKWHWALALMPLIVTGLLYLLALLGKAAGVK